MNDAEWLAALVLELVRGMKTGERVEDDAHRDLRGHRTVGSGELLAEIGEGAALDVLEDDEWLAAFERQLAHANHVRMIDGRRDACLVEEHREELLVARQVLVRTLHRDQAITIDRPREEHGGHASGGELEQELVVARVFELRVRFRRQRYDDSVRLGGFHEVGCIGSLVSGLRRWLSQHDGRSRARRHRRRRWTDVTPRRGSDDHNDGSHGRWGPSSRSTKLTTSQGPVTLDGGSSGTAAGAHRPKRARSWPENRGHPSSG